MSVTNRPVTIDPRLHDAVIFDLDGVVTDTASIHAAAGAAMFNEFLAQRTASLDENCSPFTEASWKVRRPNCVKRFITSRERASNTKRYAVAVHFRNVSPQRVAEVVATTHRHGQRHGLWVTGGRKVVELRHGVLRERAQVRRRRRPRRYYLQGVHLAAMAGSVDLIPRCFTGLENAWRSHGDVTELAGISWCTRLSDPLPGGTTCMCGSAERAPRSAWILAMFPPVVIECRGRVEHSRRDAPFVSQSLLRRVMTGLRYDGRATITGMRAD